MQNNKTKTKIKTSQRKYLEYLKIRQVFGIHKISRSGKLEIS